MPQNKITFEWKGLTDYSNGLELQRLAWQRCNEQNEALVLGLEHLPVITLGKRADPALDLKATGEQIAKRGIQVIEVDRGGEAVLHSPGQLVIYPIMNLESWNLSVRDYVEALEKATLRFLDQLAIKARRGEDEPGIYTVRGKIAFIGIRVERGITRHGIAINVMNDLELFSTIRCCGKADEKFDRLARYGVNATQIQLFRRWAECFKWSLGLTSQRPPVYSATSSIQAL
ncbi:MAG: lipoyl(octanoyl) transferase LipB [Bdellovibrionia bacterium]